MTSSLPHARHTLAFVVSLQHEYTISGTSTNSHRTTSMRKAPFTLVTGTPIVWQERQNIIVATQQSNYFGGTA